MKSTSIYYKNKQRGFLLAVFFSYAPTHDVAPSAVSIADAIDAMS
jgi:hypothetical protein